MTSKRFSIKSKKQSKQSFILKTLSWFISLLPFGVLWGVWFFFVVPSRSFQSNPDNQLLILIYWLIFTWLYYKLTLEEHWQTGKRLKKFFYL